MVHTGHETWKRRYRWVLGFFIMALVLSGVTAFPLLLELRWLTRILGLEGMAAGGTPATLGQWVLHVRVGLEKTHGDFPWMAYGTDWLAFGHVVIAMFFVEPWRRPLGNEWVLKVGLLACAGVIPLALICGEVRGIPWGWRMIDCSFGVLGALPLLYCLRCCREMRQMREMRGVDWSQ